MAERAAEHLRTTRPAEHKKQARLEIRLLGHVDVRLDGERMVLATPRKSLQVLAYLWLHRGAAVSREYLAFLIYPDDEEDSARAKLRATLSELPKILPAPAQRYLKIDSDKVAWNLDADVWIDVEAFERAAADRARLGQAIDLYRGDLLPEIYDEWLDAVRERLRNVYLRCLDEYASEARRNANFALAIQTARKALAVDPWREDVVRRIVEMRYQSGDRAGALNEYATFCKRLRDELGVEPMPETVALAERISRGAESLCDDVEERRTVAASEHALLPFVGRHSETARLLEAWNRASHGFGMCAFLGGETGIGKSRLVLELGHAIEERGGRVLVGTTSSPESVPYESVADALRSALPLLASLKPDVALASVATLLPEIRTRMTLPDAPPLDPDRERIRLFESLFRCIAGLAAQRPLLLALEDLHWAQPATIELLRFLLHRISGARVMLLMTYRSDEAPRPHAVHRLRREVRARDGVSILLGGLSVGEVEELRGVLPEARAQNAVTLTAASQGNPLFLMQLLADTPEAAITLAPASLQEAVERRIGRLASDARTLAEIAACIGGRFSHDAIRDVSAWEEASLNDALDELLDSRIVREAGGRGLEYAFSHKLLQETIVRAIPLKDVAVRRRRIAHVLEELYPDRFAELSGVLAAHYECAGDAANAGRCYLEAVRRSLSIGAVEEARALCDRALALDVPLARRAELLLERLTVEARRGDRASQDAALLELRRADEQLGDPALHRQTLVKQFEIAASVGNIETQIRAIDELKLCAGADDPRSSAEVNLAEANLELTRARLEEAHLAADAALALSRRIGDDAGSARALCLLAKIESFRGTISAALALFEEAAGVAARAGDPVLEMLALSSGIVVAYQARDMERCRMLGERCVELAVRIGDRHAEARALGRMGMSLSLMDGRVNEARRYFADAVRTCQEIGDKVGTAAQLMNGAVVETKLGFFERAVEQTIRALELFQRAGDERGRIGALANLAYLKACMGDAAAACDVGERALEGARSLRFSTVTSSALENLAMARACAGDFQRAIELANESFEIRSRSETDLWSAKTLSDVAFWHARCGDVGAALAAVERLLSDEEVILRGADWPSYCFWAAAQVFHLAGRADQAARALARARRLMETAAKNLDPEDCASFLALSFHRDVVAAATAGTWPAPPR